MAVGGMGMLSTSNYAARKFGVRAAMPGTNKARKGIYSSNSYVVHKQNYLYQ